MKRKIHFFDFANAFGTMAGGRINYSAERMLRHSPNFTKHIASVTYQRCRVSIPFIMARGPGPWKNITRKQMQWLCQGIRNGGRIKWSARQNSGGAIRRMLETLEQFGLVEGPPYRVTLSARRLVTERMPKEQWQCSTN